MMTSLLTLIVDFLTAYPHVAYLVVFLLAVSEAIPVVGVLIPGSAVIVALSALTPSGVLVLWPLLAAATTGAIIGDGVAFWLGRRYQRQILGVWPISSYPDLVKRSEAFFARHGDWSVFLARFTPGVRALIPLLAGVLGMRAARFYVVNIASALVWAPAHVIPGMLVGATIGILGAAAKPLAILVVVVVVTGWLALWVVRHAWRRGMPLLAGGAERVRDWAAARDNPASRILAGLLDPDRRETRVLAALLIVVVGAAWLFTAILRDVVRGDPLVLIDNAIYLALQELRSPPGDAIMIAITELGDTTVVVAVTFIVFLWFAWKRAWRSASYWLAAVAGASAINTAIKVALHRARPVELHYTGWSAFSFPSGHSTVNWVLYGFFTFLVVRGIAPIWRLPIILVFASLALLIAFSRLYLGAHWFSDAAGGLAFGSAWIALLALFYLRRPAEPFRSGRLLAVGCAALVLAGGLNIYANHAKDTKRYAVERTVPTIAAEEWWTSDWRQLPARRVDLTGSTREPLTVQWAGSLHDVEDALAPLGWRIAPAWTAISALSWLTPTPDPQVLPVAPLFAGGRLPGLSMVRDGEAGSRLVLRLWEVDLRLANGQASPLWIGSVLEERFTHPFSMVTLARVQSDVDGPRMALASAATEQRLVVRSEVGADWDGQVLLVRHRNREP
ncbi:VTT domain-containing protein [Mesorhizobium sp. 1B3]|uniref:bifunctional DedA family/phosphatase PAP2 family protein n=1 Tax=Mesorhizobium sp. 1B3 TaxID=3243599 RepID=UPI003D999DE3